MSVPAPQRTSWQTHQQQQMATEEQTTEEQSSSSLSAQPTAAHQPRTPSHHQQQQQKQQQQPQSSQSTAGHASVTSDAVQQLLAALAGEKSRNVELVRQSLSLQGANSALLTELDASASYASRLKADLAATDSRAARYRERAASYRSRAHTAEASLATVLNEAEERRLAVLAMFDELRNQFVDVLANWSAHIGSLAASEQDKVTQLETMRAKLAEHAAQIAKAKDQLALINQPAPPAPSHPERRLPEDTEQLLRAAHAKLDLLPRTLSTSIDQPSITRSPPQTHSHPPQQQQQQQPDAFPRERGRVSPYSALNHPSARAIGSDLSPSVGVSMDASGASSSPRGHVSSLMAQAEREAGSSPLAPPASSTALLCRRERATPLRPIPQPATCTCACAHGAPAQAPWTSTSRSRSSTRSPSSAGLQGRSSGRARSHGRGASSSARTSSSSAAPRARSRSHTGRTARAPSTTRGRSRSHTRSRTRSPADVSASSYPEFLSRGHSSYLHTHSSAQKLHTPAHGPLASSFPERPCSGARTASGGPRDFLHHSPSRARSGREWTRGGVAHSSVQTTTAACKPVYSYSSTGDLLTSALSCSLKRSVSTEWRLPGNAPHAELGRGDPAKREPPTPPQASAKASFAKAVSIPAAGLRTKHDP